MIMILRLIGLKRLKSFFNIFMVKWQVFGGLLFLFLKLFCENVKFILKKTPINDIVKRTTKNYIN